MWRRKEGNLIFNVTLEQESFYNIHTHAAEADPAYPTMADNIVILRNSKIIESVSVYNSLGALVRRQKASGLITEISFSGLHPGLYIMRVNETETVRVFKK